MIPSGTYIHKGGSTYGSVVYCINGNKIHKGSTAVGAVAFNIT